MSGWIRNPITDPALLFHPPAAHPPPVRHHLRNAILLISATPIRPDLINNTLALPLPPHGSKLLQALLINPPNTPLGTPTHAATPAHTTPSNPKLLLRLALLSPRQQATSPASSTSLPQPPLPTFLRWTSLLLLVSRTSCPTQHPRLRLPAHHPLRSILSL